MFDIRARMYALDLKLEKISLDQGVKYKQYIDNNKINAREIYDIYKIRCTQSFHY